MSSNPAAFIETHFGSLRDPRAAHSIDHKLIDILIITICATISGADNFAEIAEYGRAKEEWLKTFLELANGIPSVDTFERIFARLKPEELQKCFIGWMNAVHEVSMGELINIDGKTLRGAIIKREFPQSDSYGKCLVRQSTFSIGTEKSR